MKKTMALLYNYNVTIWVVMGIHKISETGTRTHGMPIIWEYHSGA